MIEAFLKERLVYLAEAEVFSGGVAGAGKAGAVGRGRGSGAGATAVAGAVAVAGSFGRGALMCFREIPLKDLKLFRERR